MSDIRVSTWAVVSEGSINILAREVNGRLETLHDIQSDEDFSTFLTNTLPPLPAVGDGCEAGTLYSDGTLNWHCIQTHLRTIYPPIDTPALFRLYRAQGEEWTQPTDAFDAYYIGDWVTFEGQSWTSIIDANVWSPTGYPAGWELIIEEV